MRQANKEGANDEKRAVDLAHDDSLLEGIYVAKLILLVFVCVKVDLVWFIVSVLGHEIAHVIHIMWVKVDVVDHLLVIRIFEIFNLLLSLSIVHKVRLALLHVNKCSQRLNIDCANWVKNGNH